MAKYDASGYAVDLSRYPSIQTGELPGPGCPVQGVKSSRGNCCWSRFVDVRLPVARVTSLLKERITSSSFASRAGNGLGGIRTSSFSDRLYL